MKRFFNLSVLICMIASFLSLSLVAGGCKSRKKLAGTEVLDKEISATNFTQLLQGVNPDWKYFSTKAKVDFVYTTEANAAPIKMSASLSMRMQKDSLLWISVSYFGMEVMRVKVTTDSVFVKQFQPKKNLTVKSLQEVKAEMPGFDAELYHFQRLFFGEVLLPISDYKWVPTNKNDLIEIQSDSTLFTCAQLFIKKNLAPHQTLLTAKAEQGVVQIDYANVKATNLFSIPHTLQVVGKESKTAAATATISIELQNPQFLENLTFPFSLPSNYDKSTE
jgi:hypothetical protein